MAIERRGPFTAVTLTRGELSASTNLGDLIAQAQDVKGVKLVAANIPGADRDSLAALADKIVAEPGTDCLLEPMVEVRTAPACTSP